MNNIKVTAIVLDYFKADQVVKNIEGLNQQKTDFDFNIIVIDNSCSQDNANKLLSLNRFTNVSMVINTQNLGYIKAHNEVSHLIKGDYVFIINPDIEWRDNDVLQKMVAYMDTHQDIGILGPKQIEITGKVAMSVRAFPKFFLQVARRTFLRKLPFLKKWVSYDEMKHIDYDKTQDVDWLQSSCVLVRSDLWFKIGGFSKDYFLFMGDVELSWQTWKNGLRVVYYPELTVYADGERCSQGGFKKFFTSWVLRQHVKDSLRYRWKFIFDKNPRQEYYKKNEINKVHN